MLCRDDAQSARVSFLGPLDHMSSAEVRGTAEEFILAFAPDEASQAATAARRLLGEGVGFSVMPESLGCLYHPLKRLGWNRIPVVQTRVGLGYKAAQACKRTVDVVVAALTVTLLLPLMALVALLIRLESPGPVIFSQERVGKCGKTFSILKFRSMVDGAQLEESTQVAHCSSDLRFVKIDHDRRVTRLGRTLRKTSIDELPQLWNVLRGDMSLVGPRPSQPGEVLHYDSGHFTRLLVKPGVTGMWQVSGRSDLGFEDAVRLDSAYVREWSLLLDLKIMLKTVAVVLTCKGAC